MYRTAFKIKTGGVHESNYLKLNIKMTVDVKF